MATSRPSFVSRARYTSPMPPAPISAWIAYTPTRRPVSIDPGCATIAAAPAIAGVESNPPLDGSASSDSTSRRRSVSPAHAASRNASRRARSFSRAA